MSATQHYIVHTLPVVLEIFAMQHTYTFTSLYWKTPSVIFLKTGDIFRSYDPLKWSSDPFSYNTHSIQ